MDTSPKYDFPWELIADSFLGDLPDEEKIQLQQWLEASPEHLEKYARLKELWKNGLEDYQIYQMADENKGWNALSKQIGYSDKIEGKVIRHNFVKNAVSIAAAVLVLLGAGLWLILRNNNSPVVFETASNERKIVLKDSSVITLTPQTRIEVSPDFDKINRILMMSRGEAYFEVKHNSSKPFIVGLGTTQVVDIGTSFTVLKREKIINVSVTNGKVDFVILATHEKRELVAGTRIKFDVQNNRFGEINFNLDKSSKIREQLNFENTPLSEVITVIQHVYGKTIKIDDTKIIKRTLTAHLDGMAYKDVMDVICQSFNLDYTKQDSIYLLKTKNTEQH